MSHEMGLVAVPLAASEPPNAANMIWNENGPNAWMAKEMAALGKEYWSKVPYATVCP